MCGSLVREKHADERLSAAPLRDVPPGGARQRHVLHLTRTMNDEVKKELSLTSLEQNERLEQINLQQCGLQAFADPEIQEKLALTAEQKRELADLGRKAREQMQDLTKDSGGDRGELMRKFGQSPQGVDREGRRPSHGAPEERPGGT